MQAAAQAGQAEKQKPMPVCQKKPAATIPVPAAAARNTRTVTARVYNRKNGPTMGYKEEKQHQLDLRYLRMARIWAETPTACAARSRALIVKDKMIISDGYNGAPAGFEEYLRGRNG